jgi:hypothetical protein
MPRTGMVLGLSEGVMNLKGECMKNLKLIIGLMMLALVATACSKKKSGGGAAPVQQQKYHLQNGKCYNKDTGQQVDYSHCQDDDYNYDGGQCVGWVYYTNCSTGKGYRYDCRNGYELDAICQKPEMGAKPGEIIDCTNQPYDYDRYCSGNYNGY